MWQLEGNGPFSFPFEPSKDASTRTLEARELGLCGLLLRRLLRLLLIVLLCLSGAGPGRSRVVGRTQARLPDRGAVGAVVVRVRAFRPHATEEGAAQRREAVHDNGGCLVLAPLGVDCIVAGEEAESISVRV